MAANKIERRSGALQAVLLLLVATLSVMTLALLAPVLPQLHMAFGRQPGSQLLVPMIITMPAMWFVLFSPLAGIAADKTVHRRNMLLIALALYAVAGTAPLYLNSLTSILISRALVGMFEAFVVTLSTTLIGDYFSTLERDRWLGFQNAVNTISSVFLFAMGGVLGSFGWRGPFVLYASSLIFLAAIWLVTRNVATVPHAPALPGAAAAFPRRHMFRVCTVTLFGAILFFTIQLNASASLVRVGVRAPALIGVLTAVGAAGAPVGSVIFRLLAKRSTTLRSFVAFVIVAIGLLAMGAARSDRVLTAALFVSLLGCGLLLPTLLTWGLRDLPFTFRARGIGIWLGVFQTGQFLSPFAVAALAQITGGMVGALQTLGCASAMAATFAFSHHITMRVKRPL